jgi:hypothetical protein
LVVHEGTEKVLALADYYLHCSIGELDRIHVGLGCSAFYLYAILRVSSEQEAVGREQ